MSWISRQRGGETDMGAEGKWRAIRACEECTRKCLLSDGKNAHLPTTISFFKVMIGSFSKSLFLPPKIHHRAVGLVDQSVLLEDMRGQQWRVKLSIVDGSLAFQLGWDKFVSEHGVKFGEILIFNYVVGSHFVVQIFGTGGCERLDFSTRNNSIHHKGKQIKKMESSPQCSPSIKMPSYMADKDTMNEEEASRSATTLSNASSFEMTKMIYEVEDTDKVATTLDPFDSQIIGNKVKASTSTKFISNYASSSQKTLFTSDLPCYVINEYSVIDSSKTKEYSVIANKGNAENQDNLLVTPEKSAHHVSGSKVFPDACQKPCSMIYKGSVSKVCAARSSSASLSSSDVEIIGTECNAEDSGKLTTILGKSSNIEARSKKGSDVTKASCHLNSGDSVNEEGAVRSRMSPSNPSYFEIAENKCDAEGVNKIQTSSKSSDCASRSKRKLQCVTDNDSVTEEGAQKKKAAHLLSDFEMFQSNCDTGNMENVQKGMGNSSQCDDRSKMTLDAMQESFFMMDKELDKGDMRSPTHPSGLPCNEMIETTCDAASMGKVPTAVEESSCHENNSKSIPDASDGPCGLNDGYSINEEEAAIQSKCNAEDGDKVQKSTGKSSKYSISFSMKKILTKNISEKNSASIEGASRSRTIHSNSSDSEMTGKKSEDEVVDVVTTLEKSHFNSSKMNSDASQNPCYMISSNSVSKEGATRCKTAAISFPDIGIINTTCAAEEMDKLPTTIERSSDFKSSLKRTFAASELQCHTIDGDSMNGGVDRNGTSPNSYNVDMVEGECNADASELSCYVVNEDLMNEEGDARSQTALSNFTSFKVVKSEYHSEDIDKGKQVGKNSSHFENSSTRLQYPSRGYDNGNLKITDSDICKYLHSEEQKCAYSGKELQSVLEEGNIASCLKIELKHCKMEPDESLDSIKFSPTTRTCFCCSISKNSQSQLELPACIPYNVTKCRKKYERVVVLLRDPAMRVWPVLYRENTHKKILGSGWSSFAKANNLKEGDACTFEVKDEFEAMLQVHISRG